MAKQRDWDKEAIKAMEEGDRAKARRIRFEQRGGPPTRQQLERAKRFGWEEDDLHQEVGRVVKTEAKEQDEGIVIERKVRSASFRRQRVALLQPRHLYSWREIKAAADLPPAVPGVYAWYFLTTPPHVSGRGCHRISRRSLLYVGISPGSPRSSSTIRSRIYYHFGGNASGSTLRTTLGCLLQEELGMRLRRNKRGDFRFTSRGEDKLDEWMAKYARVCWVEHRKPWEVEKHLIPRLFLPLNLAGNKDHPFHEKLSEIRRRSKARARRLSPIQGSRGR